MSDFDGMEDLLADFLQEAHELLSDVDNKLVELEQMPDDTQLLNDIFRGFHTIKGGAGFLSAGALVTLCHLTENVFDRLRNGQLQANADLMDTIMAATQCVRQMFGQLSQSQQPRPAPSAVLEALNLVLPGEAMPEYPSPALAVSALLVPRSAMTSPVAGDPGRQQPLPAPAVRQQAEVPSAPSLQPGTLPAAPPPQAPAVPVSVSATPPAASPAPAAPSNPSGRRADDRPGAAAGGGRRVEERGRESTIRVDTYRLDQVLNLSGEIGLTKNRLTSLRADILSGRSDGDTLHALDQAVSQLDLLVSDLQNSVMKTRMQPIGRLFQKYPRIARDLARQLGKEIDLELVGEETEVDKTMIEDLADPLIHLIRNAVDHGIELPRDRGAAGKPEKGTIRLEARQEGDHIVLLVADDGQGMSAERIRAKAVEKGLISEEQANGLDERQSFNLILLPGFSTKSQITDVSGRGVGMDVVKTNIQKLSGAIEIRSQAGKGSLFQISLPLTLAILPVLLVRLGDQPFALPLSLVREILPIQPGEIQEVGGKQTLVVRGEILPVLSLVRLLGWPDIHPPEYGVLMQSSERSFILAVDSFAGRDDAVIKSIDGFRPRGVAGVTTLANGQIVLILDMKELLSDAGQFIERRTAA